MFPVDEIVPQLTFRVKKINDRSQHFQMKYTTLLFSQYITVYCYYHTINLSMIGLIDCGEGGWYCLSSAQLSN